MDIREIERGLEKPGKSRVGLAKAMGRTPSAITDLLQGRRQLKAREVPIVRKYLELDPQVPIVGYVGAGSDEAHFYAEASDSPADAVPAPAGTSPDTVAVEIRGDSLGIAFNGWLAFYEDRRQPVLEHQLNRLCVVGLADDRVLIKVPRKSRQRGRFHLFPNGPGEPILDAKVEWAAVVTMMRRKS